MGQKDGEFLCPWLVEQKFLDKGRIEYYWHAQNAKMITGTGEKSRLQA